MRPFRLLLGAYLCLLASSVSGQVYPKLGSDTPRIQTVSPEQGERVVLTALPETALTVMLEPGQAITRITLEGNRTWDVRVSAETDSFQVTPQAGAAPAVIYVQTYAQTYEFALQVSAGLQAGYLVRVVSPFALTEENRAASPSAIKNLNWSYKLSGDRSVRPVSIRDNGVKTVIEYAPGQSLPAVFAIGASGEEEVVDGYVRDGRYIIDRIHRELVFRIDKEKAKAKRRKQESER